MRPAAGVAAFALKAHKLRAAKMSNPLLQQLRRQGRVDMYIADTGAGFPMHIINIYGWVGAMQKQAALDRTEELLEAIMAEVGDDP
eukprot:1710519-Alexandrium_andersonii.AAC.1